MRALSLILGGMLLAPALIPTAAQAEPNTLAMNFAIMRDGDSIGTSSLRLQHNGGETTVQVVTHVQVKIAFFTAYRFDQTETERWVDGKLVALDSVTDDNGTPHRVSATARGNMLAVEADGKASEVDPSLMPVSLWNPALMQKRIALNPQDGKVVPVSVTDHGKEQLVLQGRPETAHHYSIKTNFPQDVWYNDRQQLVKVAMRASDGSKIEYHPG
ncbi:MAG TPA: DUF6134 family protein [Stellaceae bacterium]